MPKLIKVVIQWLKPKSRKERIIGYPLILLVFAFIGLVIYAPVASCQP